MNPDRDKRISLFQEKLVKLYLRLNGYFTTGFIVQSTTKGEVETEVDIISIRFPFNQQTEREIQNSEYLQIPNAIDIIIGEVKMRQASLKMNDPLRVDANRDENLQKILMWLGLFDEGEVKLLIPKLVDCVQTQQNYTPNNFSQVEHTGRYGPIVLRPILFAPDRKEPGRNQIRYVYGNEIVEFIWKCFNPDALRKYCATDYSVDAWGEFTDIAYYFKQRHKDQQGICTMNDLYEHFVPA